MSGGDDRGIWQRCGGTYNSTTPANTSGSGKALELDRVGNAFLSACSRHSRLVSLPSGIAVSAASLGEGACSGIEVSDDDSVVYRQPVERALIANQLGSAWTGTAQWTRVGNIWTHAAGAADSFSITTAGDNAIIVGETYCVIYTLAWTSGTTGIRAVLGTANGSTRNGSGTFCELITSATNANISFQAINGDEVASVDTTTVYVIPASGVRKKGMIYPESAIKIVAIALAATPATVLTTGKVWAHWYRRPNATELT